jgi:hypothetical protein
MGYKVQCLVENRVYMLVLPEELAGSALQECDSALIGILDQMPRKVHLIVDMRAHKITAHINDARNLKHTRHPNLGRMLVVGLRINPAARVIVSLVAQVAGMPYKDFNTEQEAFSYLYQTEGIVIPAVAAAI